MVKQGSMRKLPGFGGEMISRRKFGKLALASLPLASAWGKIDSTIHGVRIGVSGYSFQYSSLDEAIRLYMEARAKKIAPIAV